LLRKQLTDSYAKLNLNSRNDTERVWAVTKTSALSTHCPWGHPHKLKFESRQRAIRKGALQKILQRADGFILRL